MEHILNMLIDIRDHRTTSNVCMHNKNTHKIEHETNKSAHPVK
jgi:hypothetical protein